MALSTYLFSATYHSWSMKSPRKAIAMQNSSQVCCGSESDGTDEEEDDGRRYVVIVNHEEQYSIWPSQRPIPPGWRNVENEGSRLECLKYIEKLWTDMRPLSVRKRMNKTSRGIGRG